MVDKDADVFTHDTIGGQAFKLCKNNWKRVGIKMDRCETVENDLYVRKCLAAGRVQVFGSKQNGDGIHIKGRKF